MAKKLFNIRDINKLDMNKILAGKKSELLAIIRDIYGYQIN